MSSQQFQDFRPEFFDSHPSDKLESFCDACEVPTSHKCAVVEHAIRGHRMMSLESASEKYVPEMKALSEKIAQKVSNLKLRKNTVNNVRKDLDENRLIADAKIKMLCQDLINAIENQKMQLHCEVDDIYNQKCKQIDAEVELLENEIATAESIHSHLNHLLTVGDRGAVDIIMAQTQTKDEQEHYDNLTNVLCSDVDSDLDFTENPDCLNMNLGVVKGKKTPEKQVKIQNSNKEDISQHDIDAATTDGESGTSSAGHCPRGREKPFVEGGVAEHTRVKEEPAKQNQGKDKVQNEPNEGGKDDEVNKQEDDADFDDGKEDLEKLDESVEDQVTKPDDKIANDDKVTLGQVEPKKKIDKTNEQKESVITRESRDATTKQTDIPAWVRQREIDEGQENGNEEEPLVVSDKEDDALDVPDQNVFTETALETKRKTHTTERDGNIITDDCKPEKHDNVENKFTNEQAFQEKEKSDAEKLLHMNEDHDDTEDTSPSRNMDQIGETQGKDDSAMPSDSQREKPNDVESQIGCITTENSRLSVHTGDEGLQLTNAQNGENQGTSRSPAENELGSIGSKVDRHAESEQADERTDVHSKADDEEEGDKTENKNKSEQPYGNDPENVKYGSQGTNETHGVGSECGDETCQCRNNSYSEKVDQFKQQYSDNRYRSHNDTDVTPTTSSIQHVDFYKEDQDQESVFSSTAGTDGYDSTKDASTAGISRFKRWLQAANEKVFNFAMTCGIVDPVNINLLFYTNKIKSVPQGDCIDNIHKHWWGDYDKLERHHGYIQWIFPVSEKGMNYEAQELQPDEAEKIKSDKKALARVLKSYEMMLDFYGMELVDKRKGNIERATNWIERYSHLNRSKHNYLRITRMLTSLGELGYEHLKTPFVHFVLKEALEYGQLQNCLNSCVQYWLHTIKSSEDRQRLTKYFDSRYDFSY